MRPNNPRRPIKRGNSLPTTIRLQRVVVKRNTDAGYILASSHLIRKQKGLCRQCKETIRANEPIVIKRIGRAAYYCADCAKRIRLL